MNKKWSTHYLLLLLYFSWNFFYCPSTAIAKDNSEYSFFINTIDRLTTSININLTVSISEKLAISVCTPVLLITPESNPPAPCDLTITYTQTSCTEITANNFMATYDLTATWKDAPPSGGITLMVDGNGTLNTTTISNATLQGGNTTTLTNALTVPVNGSEVTTLTAFFDNETTCRHSFSFTTPYRCSFEPPCTNGTNGPYVWTVTDFIRPGELRLVSLNGKNPGSVYYTFDTDLLQTAKATYQIGDPIIAGNVRDLTTNTTWVYVLRVTEYSGAGNNDSPNAIDVKFDNAFAIVDPNGTGVVEGPMDIYSAVGVAFTGVVTVKMDFYQPNDGINDYDFTTDSGGTPQNFLLGLTAPNDDNNVRRLHPVEIYAIDDLYNNNPIKYVVTDDFSQLDVGHGGTDIIDFTNEQVDNGTLSVQQMNGAYPYNFPSDVVFMHTREKAPNNTKDMLANGGNNNNKFEPEEAAYEVLFYGSASYSISRRDISRPSGLTGQRSAIGISAGGQSTPICNCSVSVDTAIPPDDLIGNSYDLEVTITYIDAVFGDSIQLITSNGDTGTFSPAGRSGTETFILEDLPLGTVANQVDITGAFVLNAHCTYFLEEAYEKPLIPCTIVATDDDLGNNCPGLSLEYSVAMNDIKTTNAIYALVETTSEGLLNFKDNGQFIYTPFNMTCSTDQFTYQLCTVGGNCCDTAVVKFSYQDTELPTLANVPADITINCDESIPEVSLVSTFDNCPAIAIEVGESDTRGADGCSLYDYTLTRVWAATDACGNRVSNQQVIEIEDITAPDIFRIYTLPNGKKMVAGVMENVTHRWKTINLPIDFSTTPLVFTQVISQNESSPIIARIKNISVAQFELKLQEAEAADNIHVGESVAWIAIESGSQSTDYPLEANLLPLSHNWATVNFSAPFSVKPALISTPQTFFDEDPITIKGQNLGNGGIDLKLEEATSLNTNITHTPEKIAYLAIQNNSTIHNNKKEIFGETGLLTATTNWQTVNTINKYHNPVIIGAMTNSFELDPATIRIRNVGINQFEIRVEEWAHLDGIHNNEEVTYIIIEGSIPLASDIICETGTDSLEIGRDWVAIDNCDVNVTLDYVEAENVIGTTTFVDRTWSSIDECGNATVYTQQVNCRGVAVRIKACLQGALISNNINGLMRDDLRKKGILPYQEPYSWLSGFQHVGNGGGELVDSSLFLIEGAKGIVDWVLIEMRSVSDMASVLATKAALIQCDGEVVDIHGRDTLTFPNVPIGEYYISIRHRNHLGLVTLNPYNFLPTHVPFIDFTYPFTPIRGIHANIEIEGIKALWAGDINNDAKVIYQGPNNDGFYMFLHTLLNDKNERSLLNFISRNYTKEDFNLDGLVIYQGPNNDRSMLLFNTVLQHPNNATKLSNFIIQVDTN